MDSSKWAHLAACRGENIQVFFEEKGGGKYAYRQAREICGKCPVIQDCFNYIMSIESDPAVCRYGMYAGMTPAQRADYQKHLDRHVRTA